MSSYCAISPTSSAPCLRRRATTSSMSSTANMMRRMPSAFDGALSGSALMARGVWNFDSSTRPWPSGGRSMAMSARTPLSPTVLSTEGPSTRVSPSSSMPSSAKNAFAASRSSTTTRTLSSRWIAMPATLRSAVVPTRFTVPVVSYSMSLSADGYVAGPDGSFDWAAPSEELHRFHNERVAATDSQLLGRRLYETMLVWDTEEFAGPATAEFAGIWRPLEKLVFSTTLTSVEGSNRLATGTLEEEIAALGNRRIAVGGAGLGAECMRRGLVDELELFVIPIVLGGGTPYFPPDVHID